MKIDFTTVDVFTATVRRQPARRVHRCAGPFDAQMQALANEFNLSETTFVLPPENPANTARVRIFTRTAEMPFAGHPNVGTGFVLARAGQSYGRAVAGDRLAFEEKAGLVPHGADARGGRRGGHAPGSAGAAQHRRRNRHRDRGRGLSLKPGDIKVAVHRPCIASCGIPLVFAELTSRAGLARAAVRTDVLAKHLPMERAVGIHLYAAAQEQGVEIQTRMFAPLFGVPEDPATGSANVALIGLLAHHRPEADLVLARTIGQGFDMGRPSLLEASAEKKAGTVTATHIGGRCVPMLTGTIDLS